MKTWQFRTPAPGGPSPAWADRLSISSLLLEMLWNRGLHNLSDMESFLSPRLAGLNPPQSWPPAGKSAATLAQALKNGGSLLVWGDYDVDGITSTALVLDVLQAHGLSARHHLPDRRREGYGLNIPKLEQYAAEGVNVLLTVDCGIADMEAVRRARELGMTVVISDHHLPGSAIPVADAVCNPRTGGMGAEPFAHLAGVGVAFYLMAELNRLLEGESGRRYKMDMALDLVALGTLADVMTLVGTNRILVQAGLKHIAVALRPGMAALKAASGFDPAADLNAGQVVFRLAPRINAAGRMGEAEVALRLLRETDPAAAADIAAELDGLNARRKAEEEMTYQSARSQALAILERGPAAGLVLHGADWHPGIIGIVASRIVEEFNRPTIVLCDDEGGVKGSGRSVCDFDLHAGLASIADCLVGFGGHKYAAGVRLKKDRLEEFRERFKICAESRLGEQPLPATLLLERELDFSQACDPVFLRELELMQPFGPGNEEPVFASPPLKVIERSFIGHGREHVRLRLRDLRSNITLAAKAWRMARDLPENLEGRMIRLAFTLRRDFYNGMPSIDLGIKDWHPA